MNIHLTDDERAAVDTWLRDLRARLLGYGADLAALMPGPDNVARAERVLRQLEAEGVIARGAHPTMDHRPTRELAFFGTGGSSYRRSRESPLYYGFFPLVR